MSGFSNIAVQNYGFFKESRCFFEGFNAENDINPETKKAGIRCHNWFTALFLRIIGKIETITTIDGKKFYLNKKSYLKWRQRHAEIMRVPSDGSEKPGPLPTTADILNTRKNVIKCQGAIRRFLAQKKLRKLKDEKELKLLQEQQLKDQKIKDQKQLNDGGIACQRRIHSRNTRKKYQELQKLHKEVKELESQTREFYKIQKNIDTCVEAKNATSEKLNELKRELAPLEEMDKALKLDVEVLEHEIRQIDDERKKLRGPEIANRLSLRSRKKEANTLLETKKEEIKKNFKELDKQQEPINAFEDIIDKIDLEINDYKAEKKAQEELIAKLKETKDKVNIMRDQILDRSAVIQLASTISAAPIEEPVVPQEPSPPVTPPHTLMLEQIKKSSGNEICALISALFSKFDSEIVKKWRFNHSTGKFIINLGQEINIWTDSKDKETPRGFVIILENIIIGTLTNKEASFERGLKGYCHYKMMGARGTADSIFKSLRYDGVKNEFHFVSLGTPREPILLRRPTKEVLKKRSYEIALGSWRNGDIVTTTPEEYLANKSDS